MNKRDEEYENFDRVVRGALKVSRDQLKAKLEEEKAAKKRKKSKKPSAFRVEA